MQIIATISKNSYSADKIEEIIQAGADILRFNFSHGNHQVMKEKIDIAKQVINQLNVQDKVKIMADLPGCKIRLGKFQPTEIPVNKGDEITFRSADSSDKPYEFIPVNFPNIADYLKIGTTVAIGDGELGFEIINILDNETFKAKALNSRHIPSEKGFVIGELIDKFDHLTALTLEHIRNLYLIKPEEIAISFVNNAEYLKKVKSLINANLTGDWHPKIISKIESPEGLKNLIEIIKESDSIMIARGDLGLCTPIEMLGINQKIITKLCKKFNKEVIVATQILDSILNYYIPTRAEVLDLTNVVLDGADAILLSKETGISLTPGYSVSLAKKIIEKVNETRTLYSLINY